MSAYDPTRLSGEDVRRRMAENRDRLDAIGPPPPNPPHARRGTSSDWMECECGNNPDADGFYASTDTGESMHDDGGNPLPEWDNEHVRCARCLAVYNVPAVEYAPTGALVVAVAVARCWNCGSTAPFRIEPDEAMNNYTDRVACVDCGESQ